MKESANKSRVIARLYASGEFCLDSAAHFGGGDHGAVDMMLLRDTAGLPCIPATSIAGASRSYLARRLHKWQDFIQGEKKWPELKLFGYLENGHKTMSPLHVDDAELVDDRGDISIRNGIRIDNKSGVTVDQAKYDFEVIEPGSRFLLHLSCVIRENDPEEKITAQFYGLLHGFRLGEIALGAKTSRGLGCGRVESWEITRLDMRKKDDILAWLRREPHGAGSSPMPKDTLPDQRCQLKIDARFSLTNSLLVRQQQIAKSLPDITQFMSGGKPTIPGTSAAGVLRSRVEFIARTLWKNVDDKVIPVLDEMFGPAQQNGDPDKLLWKSRVSVAETVVTNCSTRKQDRLAIDRFTGGAIEHKKFDEEPLVVENKQQHLQLTFSLENPRGYETGLLLLALKDLWLGRIGLGGEASLGRGLLTGCESTITIKKPEQDVLFWRLTHGESALLCSEGSTEKLQKFVAAAQKSPESIPSGGSRNPDNQETSKATGE